MAGHLGSKRCTSRGSGLRRVHRGEDWAQVTTMDILIGGYDGSNAVGRFTGGFWSAKEMRVQREFRSKHGS